MMISFIETGLGLSFAQFLMLNGFALIAALMRGFAGFGLSAVIMAGMAVTLSPLELIPICVMLEVIAGLLMVRGGLKDANMKMVKGLAIGSAIGVPIALSFTTRVDTDLTKLVALSIITLLVFLQLLRFKPKFLASLPGLYGSGVAAGMASGLASAGGMVVAVYVLASSIPAKQMRASLTMYLFLSMAASAFFLILFGVLDQVAFLRFAALLPVLFLGVFTGSALFRPSSAPYYKIVCLVFLLCLCLVGLFNHLFINTGSVAA